MNEKLLRKVDAGLEVAVAAVPPLLPVVYAHDRMRARLRDGNRREEGASVVEWVLITALLLAIVLGVGAALRQKIQSKTDTINFNTPN